MLLHLVGVLRPRTAMHGTTNVRNLYMSIYVNTTIQISNFTKKKIQRIQSYYLHTEGQRDVTKFIGELLQMKEPNNEAVS